MGNKASLMLHDEEIGRISDETGFSGQQIEKLYSRFSQLDRAHCGSLDKSDLLSIPELTINPLCDRLIEMFFQGHELDELERVNFRQFTRVLAAFRTTSSQSSSNHNQATDIGRSAAATAAAAAAASSSRVSAVSRAKTVGATKPERSSDFHDQRRHTGRQHNHVTSTQHTLSGGGLHATPRADRSRSDSDGRRNHRASVTPLVDSLDDCLRDKLYFMFKIYDVDNDGRISFNDLKGILKLMVGSYIEDVQLDKIATRAFVEVDRDNNGFLEFEEFCRVFAGRDLDDKLRVRFF